MLVVLVQEKDTILGEFSQEILQAPVDVLLVEVVKDPDVVLIVEEAGVSELDYEICPNGLGGFEISTACIFGAF